MPLTNLRSLVSLDTMLCGERHSIKMQISRSYLVVTTHRWCQFDRHDTVLRSYYVLHISLACYFLRC